MTFWCHCFNLYVFKAFIRRFFNGLDFFNQVYESLDDPTLAPGSSKVVTQVDGCSCDDIYPFTGNSIYCRLL